jgi:hypothetical protein
MHTHFDRSWFVAMICLVSLVLIPGRSAAQESKSAELATQLAQAMQEASLTAVAAKDNAGGDDRYVAAMYFPGSQLLAVSARYSVPVLLDEKLAEDEYMDVYIDLNSASIPDSKEFVSDLLADGLHARPSEGEPFDTFEKMGVLRTFNRDWQSQGLSEEAYMQEFQEADEGYAHMLEILLAQLK